MSVEYDVWESDDGLLRMTEFDPEYFRQQVSTEVKDRAKDLGLVYFDKQRWKIVLVDDPAEYGDLLELFGLEQYLRYRVSHSVAN
jgi:hypothetical protein